MSTKSTIVLVIAALLVMVVANTAYTVKETDRGLLLQFGQIVNADLKPGLGFKFPFIQEVRRFDGRVLGLDAKPAEYLTAEKKRLIVDSFVMWRIDDVKKFFTATGGQQRVARTLLAPRVNEGLRNKFGERSVDEVVSGEREQLMTELIAELSPFIRDELGIELVDIRVKKIDLPPTVSSSVYERMRAEREREAREHRSRGKETAQGITADADRERRIILATAYKEAEQTRGEGDAISANTYAAAYSQDPEFYRFHRSLSAYRETFKDKGDVMLIDPESEFFDFLKDPAGRQ